MFDGVKQHLTIPNFAAWLFYGMILYIASGVSGDLEKLTASVNALNVTIARVSTETKGHNTRLNNLEALHRK